MALTIVRKAKTEEVVQPVAEVVKVKPVIPVKSVATAKPAIDCKTAKGKYETIREALAAMQKNGCVRTVYGYKGNVLEIEACKNPIEGTMLATPGNFIFHMTNNFGTEVRVCGMISTLELTEYGVKCMHYAGGYSEWLVKAK